MSQIFDAGTFFQFQEQDTASEDNDSEENCQESSDNDSDGETETEPETEGLSRALATKYSIVAGKDIRKEEIVLLVDHMW